MTLPVAPPTRCTAPLPAKSMAPKCLLRKPSSCQIQWAGKAYTKVLKNENTMYPMKLARSATEPLTLKVSNEITSPNKLMCEFNVDKNGEN